MRGMNPQTVTVSLSNQTYDIAIAPGLIDHAGARLGALGKL